MAHARHVARTDEVDPAIGAMTLTIAGRLGEVVGRHREIRALCDGLDEQLSIQIPGLTVVIYQDDAQLDALFARAAAGVHRKAVEGLTIGVGLRLTGWVWRSPYDHREFGGGARPGKHGHAIATGTAVVPEYAADVKREAGGSADHLLDPGATV